MKTLTTDHYLQWTSYEYNRLRALIVCRLTLFNARRGGEPSRLLLTQWKDAEANTWIDQQLVRNVEDPIEKSLLGHFKLAYMSGKGTKYLVPVLIPMDVISGINKLVELRDDVGVNSDNPYLFANTQGSLQPVSGWQCVNEVCVAAGVQDLTKLTATAMRHRASTLYALEDVPEQERGFFYKHMGHGKEVSSHVYQCPLGIQEVCKVGKYFSKLDGSNAQSATASSLSVTVPSLQLTATCTVSAPLTATSTVSVPRTATTTLSAALTVPSTSASDDDGSNILSAAAPSLSATLPSLPLMATPTVSVPLRATSTVSAPLTVPSTSTSDDDGDESDITFHPELSGTSQTLSF